MPKRCKCANQNESHLSSVCFKPSYCWMAAGLAKWTVYPFSCNPSTSQYQLYVDSTTTPLREGLNGSSIDKTSGNRFV